MESVGIKLKRERESVGGEKTFAHEVGRERLCGAREDLEGRE